jgi:hypothetical protein
LSTPSCSKLRLHWSGITAMSITLVSGRILLIPTRPYLQP